MCSKMFTILELTVSNGSLKPYKEKQEMKAKREKYLRVCIEKIKLIGLKLWFDDVQFLEKSLICLRRFIANSS